MRLVPERSALPRTLAVHAGTFYESRGVDPAYAHVESFAFARVGFGIGVMMRLGDFDVTAAYSHIFQETVEVAPTAARMASTAPKPNRILVRSLRFASRPARPVSVAAGAAVSLGLVAAALTVIANGSEWDVVGGGRSQ